MINTVIKIDDIKHLFKGYISGGYELSSVYEYHNENGELEYRRVRLDHPEKKTKKLILPVKYTEARGFELEEPKFKGGKPLYNLPALLNRLNEKAYIVEGEKCVDVLKEMGVLATTSGGAGSVSVTDWMHLKGREVIIWPDNDEAGQQYRNEVVKKLASLECKLFEIDLSKLSMPDKGDVVDWKNSINASAVDLKNLPVIPVDVEAIVDVNSKKDDKSSSKPQQSQATKLVDFAKKYLELFHDDALQAYAQDKETKEVYLLKADSFRQMLSAAYYKKHHSHASKQALVEALDIMTGLAIYDAPCERVFLRVAKKDDRYYLELAESGSSRCVCIYPGRWEVFDEAPIKFIRTKTMHSYPSPDNGDISELLEFINIDREDFILVVAWLIESIRPDTPFPILELIGEQGTAKSTTQNILRQLIDPNACNLRAAPKTIEDIFVCGGANWLISYENISYLSPQMQDAFCVISTGGGFSKRKFFTDAEESIIEVKRPIVINGISACITAQDLIDRTIALELPRVSVRKELSEIEREFEKRRSYILGGLLNVFAQALERLPAINLPKKNSPRLIEFARLGMAISEVLGMKSAHFLDKFQRARQEAIARVIDGSPEASAIIKWFECQHRQHQELALNVLFDRVSQHKPDYTNKWPRSPRAFGDSLRRLSPALRQMDIDCHSIGKKGSHVFWVVKQVK